jgi:hypothetical protein
MARVVLAPASSHTGQDVLIVAPNETLPHLLATYGTLCSSIELLTPLHLMHAGKLAMEVPLFLGHIYGSDLFLTYTNGGLG